MLPPIATALLLPACSGPDAGSAPADAQLAPFRTDLLALAFRAATALPVDPHVKTRSRLQEAVVDACLEVGQPRSARTYAEQIAGWRRGTALADIAASFARRGNPAEARECLERARAFAASAEVTADQEWRGDRIRTHIAMAESAMDRSAQSTAVGAASFEMGLRAVDDALATNSLDPLRTALENCSGLYGRCYADADRRARAEAKLLVGCPRLPPALGFDLLLAMAGTAVDHADPGKARQLLATAGQLVAANRWLPEDEVSLRARLSAQRWRAGDAAGGRADLDAGQQLFTRERARIVDIQRAGALRSIAAAQVAMGATAEALATWRRAAEAGCENPNSRPRAEDLVATCCAIAVLGVAPGAELQGELHRIAAGLGPPW